MNGVCFLVLFVDGSVILREFGCMGWMVDFFLFVFALAYQKNSKSVLLSVLLQCLGCCYGVCVD